MVTKMKKAYKNMVVIYIVFCLMCICACRQNPQNYSSVDKATSIPSQIQLENIEDDQTVDPENREISRENGEEVQFSVRQANKSVAHGVDVSKWQGKIDWQKVKAAGIDFAIIRIGYRGENGIIYRDDNADYNIQQAQKAGVLVGVYFFSTATTADEARQEAAWTAEAIKGYKISYPVVYDCEGYTDSISRMYGVSAEDRTDNAIVFLKYIKNAGYDAMIYGAKSDFENINLWNISRIEDDYRVWVAHYSSVVYPDKTTPDYSGRADMWQYTNRGTVDGIDGNCDMVVSYFKADETAPKDTATIPNEATPPKTQEELIYSDVNDQVTAKDEVNLRIGAGTKFDVVATLKSGEFVTRTGTGSNGWSRLVYNGQTVYAITSYLSNEIVEIQRPDIVNNMTFISCNESVTAKIEVNLRALPKTDSEIVGTLTSGTFLTCVAKSDKGWSRLEYSGQIVYAVTSYLTSDAPQINQPDVSTGQTTVVEYDMTFELTTVNVTAKDEVNLRDMPTTDGSNIMHTLKNGEYITKTGVSKSGWARLEYNDQTVYCIDSFLMQN